LPPVPEFAPPGVVGWVGWVVERQRAVIDPAVQRSRQVPDPEPSRSRPVLDRVGHQFVNGQHHVFDSVVRKAYPAGTGMHVGPQRPERSRIEGYIENQCFVSVSCVIHLPCNRPLASASHSYL